MNEHFIPVKNWNVCKQEAKQKKKCGQHNNIINYIKNYCTFSIRRKITFLISLYNTLIHT